MDVYAREGYVINLGRAGETNARTIVFDISTWADPSVPESIISLWYAPIGEEYGTIPIYSQPYTEGNFLRWTVTSEITSLSRAGRCQLTQTAGTETPESFDDVICISQFYDTIVTESFRSNDGSIAGQLHEDWLNAMDIALAKMQYLTASAQHVPYNEQISVDVQDNIRGSYDLIFSVPVAPPFEIKKHYDSISEMVADAANLNQFDFVMIAGDVELEDSGKLFMRNSTPYTPSGTVDDLFLYCSDLSGIQGEQGFQGISITSATIDTDGKIWLTFINPATGETSTSEIEGDEFYTALVEIKNTVEEYYAASENVKNQVEQFAEEASASALSASQSQTSASTNAAAASQSASEALTQANLAVNAKEIAVSSSNTASAAASTATSAKTEAESARDLSKYWAIGTSTTGTPSNTNNSKYYAQQAIAANQSAQTAQSTAKSWAIGPNGEQSIGTDTVNAKYFSQQAQAAATESVNAKNLADIDAKNSKYWAIGKRDEDDREFLDPENPDNTDQFLNNARYYKEYIAEMEVSASTSEPGTNAQVNATSILNPDKPGSHLGLEFIIPKGNQGDTGYYFIPSVSPTGELSWSNNGNLENPQTVNITGPQGVPAVISSATASIDSTTGTPNIIVTTAGTNQNRSFNFAFSGIKGEQGEQGFGLQVIGRVNSTDNLPDPTTTLLGTAYGVGATAPYSVYILNNVSGTNQWVNYGQLAAAVQEVQIGYYYSGEFYANREAQSGGGYRYYDLMTHEINSVYIDKVSNILYRWDNIGGSYVKISDLVQSDWEQTDSTAQDFIKNKPEFSVVAISGDFNDLINKPASPVKSNWLETDSTSLSYIQNKPQLSVVAISGSYNDLLNKPTIPAAQVQSDWNITETSSKAFIKNKPTFATVAISGSYNDLSNKPTIPAAQVQSDWNETNTSSKAFILHKPTILTSSDVEEIVEDKVYIDTENHTLYIL